MAYPTAARIRQRLENLATAAVNASFCSIRTLAPTQAGTPITYLRIAKPTATKKAAVIGGMHAREWANPTAVLTCFEDLMAAYHGSTAITYGTFTMSAAQIQAIVDNLVLHVAPLMNPDGYEFSRGTNQSWRKNRRPAPVGMPNPDCIGVDLNRNHDIAWDINLFYTSTSVVNSSIDPCDFEVYTGPSAFSEPETQNVRTILDEGIQYYMDCHSQGELLLYPWAIETDQDTDPLKRFTAVNPATPATQHRYDGNRSATYEEYIHPDDLRKFLAIGSRMRTATQQATGSRYALHEGARLYCASGTSCDYAYSRHIANPAKPKVWSFTMESNNRRNGGFQPTATQFQTVEKEIHAAILTLLDYAATDPTPAAGIAAMAIAGGLYA